MTDNKGPDDYRDSSPDIVRWYILKHRKPIPEPDIKKVDKFLRNYHKKRVRRTYLPNNIYISTVFLGLDHAWKPFEEPLVFETAIVRNGEFDIVERCSTWRQALKMHWRAVEHIKHPILHPGKDDFWGKTYD